MHVAMYLRISQEKKDERDTLENHKNILIDYCKKNGYTWEEYGEVLSGGISDLNKRPQLQRLLEDIEKFDGILVIELSRLSRDGLISEIVLRTCVDYDKPIITPSQTYDLANNENDVMIYRFGSIISAHEHKKIGQRSKDNKMSMARNGMWVSGAIPYGYSRDEQTRKLVPQMEEGRAVQRIFELHAQGYGLTKICDSLNREGFKPQRSQYWNTQTVRKILNNQAYKGTVVFNDYKKVRRGGKDTYELVEAIVVDNAHQAIIEPNEFDLATRDRQERGEHLREKPSKQVHSPIKDLVFCGICGKKTRFSLEKNGKVLLKSCTNRVEGEKCSNSGMYVEYLEEDIVSTLKTYKEEMRVQLKTLEDQDTTDIEERLRERLKHVEKQLEEIEQKEGRLLDMALDGLVDNETFGERKAQHMRQKGELKKDREQLLQDLDGIEVEDYKEKIEGIMDMLENFEEVEVQQQNAILKRIIKKIHFKRDMPQEIRKLSAINPQRKYYPYEYEIEYFES